MCNILFIIKINRHLQWGENTQNNWPFGWLCYMAYKLTLDSWSAQPPTPVMGMALSSFQRNDDVDEEEDGIQGLLLGHFCEGLLWDLALSLEGRNWDVRRAGCPEFHPQPTRLPFSQSPRDTHLSPT
jgi:hypothetical protein